MCYDVVVFICVVLELLGEERKWVYYGLMLIDVVDIVFFYLLKQVNEILFKDIERFVDIIKEKVKEYKYMVMMGCIYGVYVELMIFGLKFVLWYEEMKCNFECFKQVKEGIEVGKFFGVVGIYVNIDLFVEQYVCEKFGLKVVLIFIQILQCDCYVDYMVVFVLIVMSIEKFVVEICGL